MTDQYDPVHESDPVELALLQSLILAGLAVVLSAAVAIWKWPPPDVVLASVLGLPIAAMLYPWVQLLLMLHREQERVHQIKIRQADLILRQQEVRLLEIIGDVNQDGITDEQDIETQRMNEQDLAEFVRQVWLFGRPYTRHEWTGMAGAAKLPSGRLYTYEHWRDRLIQPCLDAGIMAAEYDAGGRRHSTPLKLSYSEAVEKLFTAGVFVLHNRTDFISQ